MFGILISFLQAYLLGKFISGIACGILGSIHIRQQRAAQEQEEEKSDRRKQ